MDPRELEARQLKEELDQEWADWKRFGRDSVKFFLAVGLGLLGLYILL